MLTSIYQYTENGWQIHPSGSLVDSGSAQLVLCFGGKDKLKCKENFARVREKFPVAEITVCSTAGEIYHDAVLNNSFIAVAMQFKKTSIKTASVNINKYKNSYQAAAELAGKFPEADLAYVMIFSDGGLVNGSELVKGLSAVLGEKVLIK